MNFKVITLIVIFSVPGWSAAASEKESKPAPHCALTRFDTRQNYDLQSGRGKVLVVDFWASWCGPCARSFPFLNAMQRDYREQGLEVVGINLDENAKDAQAFLETHPARFTILADADKRCPKAFDVMGMPTSYLIDRRGNIRLVHQGFRESDAGQLRRDIEQMLKE